MRKTLAAAALGAVVLVGGQQAVAFAEPSATPTTVVTKTEQKTETVKQPDYTGLWGLLGLAGLAGLAGARRREPAAVHTVRHTEPAKVVHTDTTRVADTTVRDTNLNTVRDTNVNTVRDTTNDTLRGNDGRPTV